MGMSHASAIVRLSAILNCTTLFSGFEIINGRTNMNAPAAWAEHDPAKWQAVIQACNTAAVAVFTYPMRDLVREVYKLPFHCGDEKEFERCDPA